MGAPLGKLRRRSVSEVYAEVVRYGDFQTGVMLTGPGGERMVAALEHAEAYVLADEFKETSDGEECRQRIYGPRIAG